MRPAGALTVALAAAVLVAGHPTPARAVWEIAGQGAVQSTAGSLPAAPAPVLTEVISLGVRTVTLSWPTPADGVPVTGWRVTRSGAVGLLGGTCAGVTSALGLTGVLGVVGPGPVSCTDVPGLTGTVRYAITPVSGAWVGTASPWSAPSG